MAGKKKAPKADERIRMYFRVDPDVRRRFKAAANLAGETMEKRVERLMRDDVETALAEAASN